tara:strand:+ start:53231 stop:53995 length:765 start_codon:yes stop_codon:yes gene_type:complete
MKIFRYVFIYFCVTTIFSCSTKKEILYVQNISSQDTYSYEFIEYQIKTDDILKIDVNSEIPEAATAFNPMGIGANLSDKTSMLYNGYQVNNEGYINFPSIGEIKVQDLTISQIRELIYDTIVKSGILINPSVDVKIINSHFTILGEVSMPGRYEYLKNNMNILEAIGMAGDLNITGKRSDIKLIRDIKGKKSVYNIDITDKNILLNNAYQIFSGDIIIVNPNTTRVKNAGVIGNSGTLLSLLSFLLTSIIVINN